MAKYTSDASGGELVKSQHFDAPDDAPAYIRDAAADIGIHEWVKNGAAKRSNPVVEEWIAVTTGKRQDATNTPWCAYYVNAKLEKAKIKSTKNGMARAYLNWGEAVEDDDWQVGDICVFQRGEYDDHVLGHVTFLVAWDENTVTCLGGNQHDMVCIEQYPRRRLLGVRRYRSVWKSKTIVSAAGSAATEGVAKPAAQFALPEPDKVGDAVESVRGPLEALSHAKPWIIGILTALSIGLALYACYWRFRDHNSGKNT
jgi:uncharacterized protein (TIGR02594 family)